MCVWGGGVFGSVEWFTLEVILQTSQHITQDFSMGLWQADGNLMDGLPSGTD